MTPQVTEHLLVDGYNLIKTTPLLSQYERTNLQAARIALQKALAALAALAARRAVSISLFYDGEGDGGQRNWGSLRIRYSSSLETADDLIMQEVQSRHGSKRLRVISSDRAIRNFARRHRIRTTSSSDFVDELFPELEDSDGDEVAYLQSEDRDAPALEPSEIDEWERLFRERSE